MNEIGEAGDMFARYLMILNNRSEAFRDVFTSLAEAEGCVLFHCYAGKDRTGLIAALLLAITSVEPDHSAADFAATAHQLPTQYAKWIGDSAPEKRDREPG